jgi:hypothetical protein
VGILGDTTNLIQTHPEKAKTVIASLKPYLPKSDAVEVPKSEKSKSAKEMDETIKARRNLTVLR